MGVLYLQDAVCLLPARPDLEENMQYIAEAIEEMGGTYHLFSATTLLPGGDARLTEGFRAQADTQLREITERLEAVSASLGTDESIDRLEHAEEMLKRERIAYLRAKRLAFFGSHEEEKVQGLLDTVRHALDNLYRSEK